MKDMTQGNPLRQILTFAVPMLIASIFQQFYNFVDTLIVGRYLGANALAGVGSTGTLTFLILNLALGMTNGGGLIIAQCFGRDERRQGSGFPCPDSFLRPRSCACSTCRRA